MVLKRKLLFRRKETNVQFFKLNDLLANEAVKLNEKGSKKVL